MPSKYSQAGRLTFQDGTLPRSTAIPPAANPRLTKQVRRVAARVVLHRYADAIEVFPGRQAHIPGRHLAEREEVSRPDGEQADAHRDGEAGRALLQLPEPAHGGALGGHAERPGDACGQWKECQRGELG